jgi:hypothetical protein
MAEWNGNPSWTPKEQINGGQQFNDDDILTPEEINALVENMQYLYLQGGNFEVNPYPIGSIFMSVESTSPAYLFGGSWERIQDKFLLSAGGSYPAGSIGGKSSVTLTVDQIPSHRHGQRIAPLGGGWSQPMLSYSTATTQGISITGNTKNEQTKNAEVTTTQFTGGGLAHENMPPYLAVYTWKRIA